MVDFFLLVQIAGAGDELQGIKRGIMEMADSIIINKADGNNITKAELAKVQLQMLFTSSPSRIRRGTEGHDLLRLRENRDQ